MTVQTTRRLCAALLAAALAAPTMAQIYKCPDPAGRTVIQQLPCAGGQVLDVRPASGTAPDTAAEPQPASVPPRAAPAPVAAPAPEPVVRVSQIERDAATCLDWYREFLANPRDAYYTHPRRERNVLTITLHATNRYGGIVTEPVRCEMVDGRLDERWTRIHAERLHWLER